MPAPVYDEIVKHLSRERELGGYEAADEAQADVDRVYSDVARVVGAQARNIAIVENASDAFTRAVASFHLQPGCRVLDRWRIQSAIVTATVDGWDSQVLVTRLRESKINTSATFRRWAWFDMTDKGVEHAVRISPHYYNTDEEIDRFIGIVREIVRR